MVLFDWYRVNVSYLTSYLIWLTLLTLLIDALSVISVFNEGCIWIVVFQLLWSLLWLLSGSSCIRGYVTLVIGIVTLTILIGFLNQCYKEWNYLIDRCQTLNGWSFHHCVVSFSPHLTKVLIHHKLMIIISLNFII